MLGLEFLREAVAEELCLERLLLLLPTTWNKHLLENQLNPPVFFTTLATLGLEQPGEDNCDFYLVLLVVSTCYCWIHSYCAFTFLLLATLGQFVSF